VAGKRPKHKACSQGPLQLSADTHPAMKSVAMYVSVAVNVILGVCLIMAVGTNTLGASIKTPNAAVRNVARPVTMMVRGIFHFEHFFASRVLLPSEIKLMYIAEERRYGRCHRWCRYDGPELRSCPSRSVHRRSPSDC